MSLGDHLYTAEEVRHLEPPEWLVEGVIPDQSFVMLYGQPGSFKTFLALSWSVSIASGAPWLGHQVRRGPVVYVAAEGMRGMGKRLDAHLESNEPDLADFYVLGQRLNLMDRGEVQTEFVSLLKNERNIAPRLIVVDTLALCLPTGDENLAGDVGQGIDNLIHLRDTLNTTVCVVHHPTKKGDTPRGTSALAGAVDTNISVKLDSLDSRSGVLSCELERNFERFEPIPFSMVEVADSLIPTSSLGGQVEDFRQKARDVLTDHKKLSTSALTRKVKGHRRAFQCEQIRLAANDPECPIQVEENGKGRYYYLGPARRSV